MKNAIAVPRKVRSQTNPMRLGVQPSPAYALVQCFVTHSGKPSQPHPMPDLQDFPMP